nr:methanogen output domain 1-containing protein [Methanobacterium formicicum]
MFRYSCVAPSQNWWLTFPFPKEVVFLSRFMRLFEQNMKPLFIQFTRSITQEPYEDLSDRDKMRIYLSWISQLYENLGFKVLTRTRDDKGLMTVKKMFMGTYST